MPDDRLRLNNQLCFALYAAANAITRSYRGSLGEIGLTYPQYLVMLTLLEHTSMTSGELARTLKLDAGTLTPMLKRLAAAGLVERTRRMEDERVIDNRLSEAGRALQGGFMKASLEMECRTGMAPDEIAALRKTLVALTESLAKLPEDELALA